MAKKQQSNKKIVTPIASTRPQEYATRTPEEYAQLRLKYFKQKAEQPYSSFLQPAEYYEERERYFHKLMSEDNFVEKEVNGEKLFFLSGYDYDVEKDMWLIVQDVHMVFFQLYLEDKDLRGSGYVMNPICVPESPYLTEMDRQNSKKTSLKLEQLMLYKEKHNENNIIMGNALIELLDLTSGTQILESL